MKAIQRFKTFLRGERGVSALEYAMLVGVVAVVVVAALGTFAGEIEDAIEAIATNIGANTTIQQAGQ